MNKSECEDVFGENNLSDAVSTSALSYVGLFIAVFTFIYHPACIFYFIWHRKRHERLRRRNLPFLILVGVGYTTLFLPIGVRTYVSPKNFFCDGILIVNITIIAFSLFVQLARAFRLYFIVSFNKCVIDKSFLEFAARYRLNSTPGTDADANTVDSSVANSFTTLDVTKENAANVLVSARSKTYIPAKKSFTERYFATVLYKICRWKHPSAIDVSLKWQFFLSSNTFIYFFYAMLNLCILLPVIIVNIIVFGYIRLTFFECKGCRMNLGLTIAFPVVISGTIIAFYIVYKIYKYPDTFGLKGEIRFNAVVVFVFQILIAVVLRNVFEEIEDDGLFEFSFFTSFASYLISFYIYIYQVWIAQKQAKNLEHTEDLDSVLSSVDGKKAFAVHLGYSLALENLLFHESVEEFKRNFKNNSKAKNSLEAKKICDKFIAEESPFEINISYELRNSVLKEVVEDDLQIETSFDLCINDVHRMLLVQFNSFLETKFYKAYINALGTIEEGEE